MATDYKSSLPVRTEVDPDQRLQSKIVDFTNPALGLEVQSDGSITSKSWTKDGAGVAITSTVVGPDTGLDVNILNALVISATNLDIRDLVFATDKVDVSGSEVSLDATTLAALENITVSATDLDIRDLVAATDSVSAHLKDEAGVAFGVGNPLAVTVVNAPTEGTPIHDFNETAALAQDTGETVNYTVPASNDFYLTSVLCSASGVGKFEIKVAGATKAVVFNSTANPNFKVEFDEDLVLAAAALVEVVCTNKDQTQSMYVTIIGELRAI